jgi:exonuclease III
MSKVANSTRMRKFYGIASLKTDVIFLCDLRMCNRAGTTDMAFINNTFAINPHCSYKLIHHSTTNSHGVGILVKKSLIFNCLDIERDPGSNNFILLKAEVLNQTVILGSIYGPNNRDDEFFVNLSASLNRLGNYPTIIGGDWNATLSCLPVRENPDVLNMQDLPNTIHSRKINDLCLSFNLSDPFRILFPNRIDFSYAPWNNIRNNRSRIDFFLISNDISECVTECSIKPHVQSKLFDHKAILLSFKPSATKNTRPVISENILRDPDIEIVVKLASYECYLQNAADIVNKIDYYHI